MWQQTFTKEYVGISKADVWRAWKDVENWPRWDTELDYCSMCRVFQAGSTFILKPHRGPKVKLTLSEVITGKAFTDFCRFPGATMTDAHYLEETNDGVKITNQITLTGPLGFIWRRLVAQKVADSVPTQTDNLIRYLRERYD